MPSEIAIIRSVKDTGEVSLDRQLFASPQELRRKFLFYIEMPTIVATRRGFLYQDIYAVLEFLKFFQANELSEFYTDFTFSGQRSIDIKVVLNTGLVKIIEVKSGQNFIQDARKKDTSEVREAFIEFAEHRRINGDTSMAFVLSPDFKERPRIFEYWQHLIDLRNIPTFTLDAKRKTKWLYEKLRLPQISTHEELYEFVRNLEIAPGDTDSHDNQNDPYSDIEDKVMQKIRDICSLEHFDAAATEPELPCDILFYELIYICQKNAGSNLFPALTDKVLNFISRRKMLLNNSRNLRAHRRDVDASFSAWSTGATVPEPGSVATMPEGGAAHE